jgi:hypothetical protein
MKHSTFDCGGCCESPRLAAAMRHILRAVFCLTVWLGLAAPLRAGGGPENLLLVVNSESSDSMTIANRYVQLRQIPAGNVMYLPWDAKIQTTDIDTFREKILLPVLDMALRRHPPGQID